MSAAKKSAPKKKQPKPEPVAKRTQAEEARYQKFKRQFEASRDRHIAIYQGLIDMYRKGIADHERFIEHIRSGAGYCRVCLKCNAVRDNSYTGGDHCPQCGTLLTRIEFDH